MAGNTTIVDLPSKPVLEMALNLEIFRAEVRQTLQEGRTQDLEYVLLKVAMEVQDKANMLTMMRSNTFRPKT